MPSASALAIAEAAHRRELELSVAALHLDLNALAARFDRIEAQQDEILTLLRSTPASPGPVLAQPPAPAKADAAKKSGGK